MNYNHSNSRRGKPKRILDPSTGLCTPTSPPNPYVYSQMPINNGLQSEYGFSLPEQTPPPQYGFQQPISSPLPPMGGASSPIPPPYSSEPPRESFASPQFAAQLLTDPMVTNMAMKYGDTLVGSGKQHLEKYVPVTALKYYFAVDTDYVFIKLALLFFPFTHRDWSVKYEQDVPLQPRYEKNAPDMYIPTMAFLTYVVMAGLSLGTQGRFTPEQLGILASSALAWGVIELVVHTTTLYVMNLETSLRTLDMLAYCGYKYVGINVALLFSLMFGKFGYYTILIYYSISLAFFLIRSLKLRVIPEGHSSYTASGNKRRLYFILFVAMLQPCLMWWLSYHLI
ncbi:protein YIF1B [Chelonus insularis]|uniref:protein YIF1B n=1 Tax=Chelonus insularis TaxID=460826 RepID=UPI001588949A|nr:protein YIF1B [Chelonus insularis]